MCLISGSAYLLNLCHRKLKNSKCLLITSQHRSHRKIPESYLPLLRMKHVWAGEVTTWEYLYASSNITGYTTRRTNIRRRIGGILNYGIKPNLFIPTTITANTSVLYDEVMPVNLLEADIIFPTSYSKNDWGYRPLNKNDLATCFGIPTSIRVSTLTHKDFKIVPCQMLKCIINLDLKEKVQRKYASLKRE